MDKERELKGWFVKHDIGWCGKHGYQHMTGDDGGQLTVCPQCRAEAAETNGKELAQGILGMSQSLYYINGICDKAGYEGTDEEQEHIALRILGYVKQLEAENAKLRKVVAAHSKYLMSIHTWPTLVDDCDCTGCDLIKAHAALDAGKEE
jgi:hypothetical protein